MKATETWVNILTHSSPAHLVVINRRIELVIKKYLEVVLSESIDAFLNRVQTYRNTSYKIIFQFETAFEIKNCIKKLSIIIKTTL